MHTQREISPTRFGGLFKWSRQRGERALNIEVLLEIEGIKKLRIMYLHYLDGGDVDSLASLFCEDAVCEFGENYGGDWFGRPYSRLEPEPGWFILCSSSRSGDFG